MAIGVDQANAKGIERGSATHKVILFVVSVVNYDLAKGCFSIEFFDKDVLSARPQAGAKGSDAGARDIDRHRLAEEIEEAGHKRG